MSVVLTVVPVNFDARLSSGYYDNKMQWPAAAIPPSIFHKRIQDLTPAEAQSLLAVVLAFHAEEDAIKKARDAYKAETRRLTDEFEVDLAAHHGMTNHPRRQALFDKAWEDGHADGYLAVAGEYESLIARMV